MAGKGQKLVNKLHRRSKSIKNDQRGRDTQNKVHKNHLVLQESPRALELTRKAIRRADRAFGNDTMAGKTDLQERYIATTLARVASGPNHVMQLTMPANVDGYTASGILPGDIVEIVQQGSPAQGYFLTVLTLVSNTVIQLTDISSLSTSFTESNVCVRFQESSIAASYY